MYIDYRALNEADNKGCIPTTMRIDSLLECLGQARVFSKVRSCLRLSPDRGEGTAYRQDSVQNIAWPL